MEAMTLLVATFTKYASKSVAVNDTIVLLLYRLYNNQCMGNMWSLVANIVSCMKHPNSKKKKP